MLGKNASNSGIPLPCMIRNDMGDRHGMRQDKLKAIRACIVSSVHRPIKEALSRNV